MFDANSLARRSIDNNYLTEKGRGEKAVALAGQPRIPLSAKADSPLRGFLWILPPQPIRFSRLASDLCGQLPVIGQKIVCQIGIHRAARPMLRTRPARM